MASWKWAEMMADLYEREAVSHSEIGDYEPSPEQPWELRAAGFG